ncbi:cyclic nucleotide-binding/CBS domain-containing protein [Skermanella sp. TT6]|uniref:Cyclic nucleotide-binding/CBS domain-containing protein n=1 Tax=Skermanella cutis TaxID=2775420 RepID=A0ABX7B2T7_9PROT|nr:cyclic nucleotide-binding/CBS domain-containing protein [Skermanella sp. TT6]
MVSRGSAPPRLWLSPRRPKAANLGAFFLGSGFPDLQRRRCSDVFEAFSFTIAPFDRLTPAERDQVMAASDIAVWPKGATVLRGEEASGHLHIVLKGLVQELSGTEVLAAYGPGESFDVKALLGSPGAGTFVAREDTVCQLLPQESFLDLTRTNPRFGVWFHQEMIDRLRDLAVRQANREMTSFMMARIRQAYIHPAAYVGADCSARDAVAAMKATRSTSLLVRGEPGADGAPGRVGILSDRDLRDAVILDGAPVTSPVGPLASYSMISLDIDDFLFNALVVMTKHGIRRVVVTEGEAIVGILEQVDLLGFLSNNSHIVAIRVERASDLADLRAASAEIPTLIQALHGNGVKIRFIAEMVTALNRRIFAKLFELLAPPDLLANSCLIVMGSEGRGEQILKTDQDNGLILRDGYACPDLESITAEFSRSLIEFGYPQCPGGIMVNTPEWTRPLAGYRAAIHGWVYHPDEAAQLNLAIFYDAAPVAGDATLLDQARDYLIETLSANDMFFSHFARPTLSFDTPIGLFSHLKGEELDIKKGGIFPLVHGVRSLALEKRLQERNTIDRIRALQDLGVFDATMATELTEALLAMLELRLKLRLAAGDIGTQTDNFIRPDQLNRLERDLLKDSLSIVKRFKEFITYHFHLKMF